MGPKKRGKKKGEPKPKITKTQYLTMIAESNAVLAQERRKIDEVLECYLNSEKKYDQIQVDMADILKYLQHEIEVYCS